MAACIGCTQQFGIGGIRQLFPGGSKSTLSGGTTSTSGSTPSSSTTATFSPAEAFQRYDARVFVKSGAANKIAADNLRNIFNLGVSAIDPLRARVAIHRAFENGINREQLSAYAAAYPSDFRLAASDEDQPHSDEVLTLAGFQSSAAADAEAIRKALYAIGVEGHPSSVVVTTLYLNYFGSSSSGGPAGGMQAHTNVACIASDIDGGMSSELCVAQCSSPDNDHRQRSGLCWVPDPTCPEGVRDYCQGVGIDDDCHSLEEACVAGDTKIRLADGSEKLASAVKAGDSLWNPALKRAARVRRVTNGREWDAVYTFTAGSRQLRVNRQHPMATLRGLIPAEFVIVGDQLTDASGAMVKVTAIEHGPIAKGIALYNFELEAKSADPTEHMLVANDLVTGDVVLQNKLRRETAKPSFLQLSRGK